MEVYTPFDELVIFSFMFVWLCFGGLVALAVDKLMWKMESKNDKSADTKRSSKLHKDSGRLHCDNCRDMADRSDRIPDRREVDQ